MQRGSLNAWPLISYSEIIVGYHHTRGQTPAGPHCPEAPRPGVESAAVAATSEPRWAPPAPYLASLRSSFLIYQMRALIAPVSEGGGEGSGRR